MTLYLKLTNGDVYLVEKSGKVVSLFISEEAARTWCKEHNVNLRKYKENLNAKTTGD
jgi:hypothetical protein